MLACPTPVWWILLYPVLFFGPLVLAAGFGLALLLWATVGGWRVGTAAITCAVAAAAFAVVGIGLLHVGVSSLAVAACAAGLAAVRRGGRLS